nr:unnamed protein product [Callosobruchus chinensis]
MSKCKVLHINKGQWKNHPQQEIVAGQTLDNMDKNETYKYLSSKQSFKIDHTQAMGQITQEFRDRLTRLLKTKLHSRNLTRVINTFAIPVLTFSIGITKWSLTDIENIHILIQTELTKHRMSHPNAQEVPSRETRGDQGEEVHWHPPGQKNITPPGPEVNPKDNPEKIRRLGDFNYRNAQRVIIRTLES